MFSKSRFVVVDDKVEHLKGIKDTLNELQLDCHSKHYLDEAVAGWEKLPGVRILFMDQNLVTGATFGSGDKPAFAAIADVIQQLICPNSGPYGIVLWAEEPDAEALKAFLFERFTDDAAKLLPVFMTVLRKGEYIDTSNGEIRDPLKLQADLQERISSSPQMKAMFAWEADVFAATDAVLRSLVDLVPPEKRASDEFANELGKIYYRLSQAGAGIDRAEENPREAVNHVLVPILADRISRHDPDGKGRHEWKEALVAPPQNEKFPAVRVSAAMNSAIHQSFELSGIQPTDLGAVLEFPWGDVDKALDAHFGITRDDFTENSFFGLDAGDWKNCSFRLIQIGAACDHAQPKKGPLLYLLALEWAFTHADGSAGNNGARLREKKTKKAEAEWRSPTLLFAAEKEMRPGKLSAFLNCPLSISGGAAAEWTPLYRLREELVSQLTQRYARHISRPGVVKLGPDD